MNKEADMYTTTDICKMTGASRAIIRQIADKAGIESYYSKIRHGIILYNSEGAKQIAQLYQNQITLREIKKRNRAEPKTIEELRAEHPLVKDDRFFKLSYFPDIIPKCFEED